MREKNRNNVIGGLVIILFAAALFMEKMGVFPNFPVVKIGMSAILLYVMAICLRKLEFVGVTFPLGLIACLFSKELGIDMVSPAIIILVSVLVGIGLTLMFGETIASRVKRNVTEHIGGFDESDAVSYAEGEGSFDVDNNMGKKTEYISIKNLKRGNIDNALGAMIVYLNGTTIDADGAIIDVDNGLGSLKVYIPKEWRVSFNTENGLGKIDMHGRGSDDNSSPLVNFKVDNGLGNIDFYFE